MQYELVNLETSSLVGVYPSQGLALAAVLATVAASGESAVDNLALGRTDPTGQTDGEIVADGRTLLALARDLRSAA